jgi:1,4-alpha-glucan branching enzyme
MAQYKIRIVILITIAVLFSGCNLFKKEVPKAGPYPEWVKNSVIYRINMQQHSPGRTFIAIEADLPRIKALGADVLWFMPIHPIGEQDRKIEGRAGTSPGSYYSVQDYREVNPEFGTQRDFKNLVIEAHRLGLKVIIDWVPNHTSRDNDWVKDHPEWYKRDDKGNIAAPFGKTDCAQLNYDNKNLRRTMINAMKSWVVNFGIDGFSGDAAGIVPADFWEDARTELQHIKPIFMLAENEDKPEMCKIAFDSNLGREMYHLMTDIAQGKKKTNSIPDLQSRIDSVLPQRAFKVNFIANHDENLWNGTAKGKLGKGEKSCAVLTYTLPGMPLIYNGQEAGMTKLSVFFAKDTVNRGDTLMTSFYKTLNSLKHRNQALWNPPFGGKFLPLTNSAPDKIVSFLRLSGPSRVMVLINMSPDTVTTMVTTAIADGKYINTFNHNKITFNPDNHICYFEPWEYLVLEGE